jgi:hypothetical protein
MISPKEFIVATITLIAIVAAQIIATHATALLHATPWLDEVHTGILVAEPDAAKFRAAVSTDCVDANFPVYCQLLRTFHITSLPAIRMLSLLTGLATLLGIYLLLRGAFTPLESAVGVLTVWATPMMVYQSFQARFYVPWFAALIAFALAMRWMKSPTAGAVAAVAVALTSVLTCTLHMLGLPAVGLIVLAELLTDRRPTKARIIAVLPALAGVIAVACFVPLMITQKHSFEIRSWLVGNPVRLLYSTSTGDIPGVAMTVLILGMFVSAWIRRADSEKDRPIALAPLAGISALIFFPLVLFVITLLFQPVLLARYALICTAPIAAASALAASRMHRFVAIGVCLALAAESGAEMSRQVRGSREDAQVMGVMLNEILAHSDEPVLFETRHQLFPVAWVARDLVDRCAYVDFEAGPNQLDPVVEGFERDLAKKFQRVFGWPKVMPWAKVISQDRFMLVPIDEDDERIATRFAGFSVQRIGPKLFQLTATRPQTRTSYSP